MTPLPLSSLPLPNTVTRLSKRPLAFGGLDSKAVARKWLENAGYIIEPSAPPALEAVTELWARLGMDDTIAALLPAITEHGDEAIKKAIGFWRAGFKSRGPQGVLDALIEREQFLRLWQIFLEDYPLILMPSSAEPAFPNNLDLQGYEAYERIWKAQLPQLAIPVLGLPAANVPTGEHNGLPMGVQIVAGRFREDLILEAAEIIEAHGPRSPLPLRHWNLPECEPYSKDLRSRHGVHFP